MKDRKVKQVLFEVWYQWEEVGHLERVKESKYGGSTLNSCMKMEK
jgi:hypothetical protein